MATLLQTENKLRETITDFTNLHKDLFSSGLAQQLEELSAKLDEQQLGKLQAIPVADVVHDVTNKVVDNVVKEGLALLNPAVAPPLRLLTREVATQLVGKPMTRDEAAKKIDDQLSDLAAATYVSEIAQAMLNFITPTQPATETHQQSVPNANSAVDNDLKTLASAAALAASPLGALYDSTGTRFRAVTMKDAGNIIMAGAPFFGPDAPLVFAIGALMTLM